jgi:hypothetical protein
MLSTVSMEYKKIDACKNNCMLFYKEHKNEMKYLKCGKSKFVEVVNEDDENVMTKVGRKQLCYMSNVYYKDVLGQKMNKKLGSLAIYLIEEQYSQVNISKSFYIQYLILVVT